MTGKTGRQLQTAVPDVPDLPILPVLIQRGNYAPTCAPYPEATCQPPPLPGLGRFTGVSRTAAGLDRGARRAALESNVSARSAGCSDTDNWRERWRRVPGVIYYAPSDPRAGAAPGAEGDQGSSTSTAGRDAGQRSGATRSSGGSTGGHRDTVSSAVGGQGGYRCSAGTRIGDWSGRPCRAGWWAGGWRQRGWGWWGRRPRPSTRATRYGLPLR
jgi:hypothetical protein